MSLNVASTGYTSSGPVTDASVQSGPIYDGTNGTVLTVPYYNQGDTSWCLYYCLAMMSEYNNRHLDPWEIASHFNSGNNETFAGQYNPFDHALEEYLRKNQFLEIKKTVWGNNLKSVDIERFDSMVRSNIDRGQPVLMAFQYSTPGYAKKGHALLAVGYNEEFIYLTDPSGAITEGLFGIEEGYIAVPILWEDFNEKLAGNIMPTNMAFTIEMLEDAPAITPAGSIYMTDYSNHGYSCLTFVNRTNMKDIGLLRFDGKHGKGYYIARESDLIAEREPTPNDTMSVYFTVANPSPEERDYIVLSEVIGKDTGNKLECFRFPIEITVPPYSDVSKGVNYSNHLGTISAGTYSIVVTLLDSDMKRIGSTSIDVSIS